MATKIVIAGSTVSAQQLKDFFRQIANGGITGMHLQALLERRNPFEQLAAGVVTQTVTVLGGISLATRITAGKYDWVNEWVNEHVTEQNFRHDPTSVGEWEWKLVDFGRDISSEDAVLAIAADGWQPALIEHLLAFGEKYPNEQRKYPIVALGSSGTVNGDRVVPELWDDDTERGLYLRGWSGAWDGRYRFLVVRRKV